MKYTWNLIWNLGNVAVAILATIYGNQYAINLSKFFILPIGLSAFLGLLPDKELKKLTEEAKFTAQHASYYWTSAICDLACAMIYAAGGRWFLASLYFFSISAARSLLKLSKEKQEAA